MNDAALSPPATPLTEATTADFPPFCRVLPRPSD
jgi:hypothetical protein